MMGYLGILAIIVIVIISIWDDRHEKEDPDTIYERWREEHHIKDL